MAFSYINLSDPAFLFLQPILLKDVIVSYDSDDSLSINFIPSFRGTTTQCASWTDNAPHEKIASASYREGMGYLGEVSSGRVRSEVWKYET